MEKKILVINSMLSMVVVGLLWMGYNAWRKPAYPSHVEVATSPDASQKFAPPPPIRETYQPAIPESVTKQNLFRKERAEYVPPPPPPPAPPRPNIPPPNLKVSGIMLFSSQKNVAIMEGTYSILNEPATIENKTLKKKGYYLGDQIGNYQITDINRTSVLLDNKEGGQLNIKLATRAPEDIIQRNGNHFFHKYKAPRPPGSAGTPGSPAGLGHVSGASTPIPSPSANQASAPRISEVERVSGSTSPAPTTQGTFKPNPQGRVSGASSAGSARISGG